MVTSFLRVISFRYTGYYGKSWNIPTTQHKARTQSSAQILPGGFSFIKTVSKSLTLALKASHDLSLTVSAPTPLPYSLPSCHMAFLHNKHALPQGLCTCRSLVQKAFCPDIYIAHSLTLFRSWPNYHLLRKASADLPAQNSPPFNLLPPFSLFCISPYLLLYYICIHCSLVCLLSCPLDCKLYEDKEGVLFTTIFLEPEHRDCT